MATTGMQSVKTSYRLSPNEEAALIKQEKERRRKLRIQQVREQERNFASKIRSNVSKKKGEELKNLTLHLKQEWEQEKKEKTDALQEVFERSLESVGDGHRAASGQPPLAEIRAAQFVKDQHVANQRYNTALKRHQQDAEQQYQKENAHIIARKSAIGTEKARAAKIASLSPPVKDPVDDLDDVGKENQIVTVVSGFSTSHYHLKGEYVERAEPHEQEDARAAAEEEERRAKEETAESEREEKERQEKAELRHQHARKQELLHQDYNKLMVELGQMEQADRRRRQAIVANIPHQVFQPPHKRLEDKREEQQKLEQAFEDMYMANTDYTGDLILALEPKPKHDADLDVTVDSVSDDVGISLQPVPIPPPEKDDAGKRFPHGIDEDDEMEAERTIVEEKPRQPRAPLKTLMDRIKTQREQLKKKVILEVPGPDTRPGEDSETSPSSRDLPGQGSSSPPSPASSQDVSESERSSADTLETGTLSEDSNKQEKMAAEEGESMTLLHPMEEAAKIRSTNKMPDVEEQKQAVQEIMAKEDVQRLRLAEQQLQDHVEHRDHLQMLQDNLLQRQRMLQQQIEEQERQHREQLQLQQQEFGQQQSGLWSGDLQQKQHMLQRLMEEENQHMGQQQEQGFGQQHTASEQQYRDDNMQQLPDRPQQSHRQHLPKENTHPIQRLIKQLQVSDQQRQQQRAQQQQQLIQQPDQQHDLTQYHKLPDQLFQQQQLTNQLHQPEEQLQQQQQFNEQQQHQSQITSVAADFQMPKLRHSQPAEMDAPTRDRPTKTIHEILDTKKFQSVQHGLSQIGEKPVMHFEKPTNLDSSGYEIPITVRQGHSHEFLQCYGHQEGINTAEQSQPNLDQDRRQLPSRDTLQEAQVQLQQRRERLMQLYPELKLPLYEPYIKDTVSSTSTRPPTGTVTDTRTHSDRQIVQDAELRSHEDESGKARKHEHGTGRNESWILPSLNFGEGIPILATGSGASTMTTGASTMTTGASAMGTDVSASRPDKANALVSDAAHALQSDVSKPPDSSPATGGLPLNEMERQLEQHRQLLLKTRQQLQQQQQQQQQRILDKQRVLGQRIEQQRQEQLARQCGHMMSDVQPHDVMMSQPGTQRVMTSQTLPRDVMTSHAGTQEMMTSETHEAMARPKRSTAQLAEPGILDAKAQQVSEFEQIQQNLSETSTEETSDRDNSGTSTAWDTYKLPTMTFGQSVYPFDPTGESPRGKDDRPPSFHELSPDSSSILTESSDHHQLEIAPTPHEFSAATSASSSSETGGIRLLPQPLQYDWQTVLASNLDLPKHAAPAHQSALQSTRVHTRPPPAQLRLPQPVEEAAPHELSTIVEVESPGAEQLSRGHPEVNPVASTPHKSSPPLSEYNQFGAETKSSTFFPREYTHLQTEAGSKASRMVSVSADVSGRYFSKTSTEIETSEKPTEYSQVFPTDGGSRELGATHTPSISHFNVVPAATAAPVPTFSVDIGRGVLSYHASKLMSTGPAIIRIASPATDNEGVLSQPGSSSVSTLSEHTLLQSQHSLSSSLLGEESVERFQALSAYDSTTSDSVSSTSARYQLQVLGSDRRSSKSPVIKDFVMGVPSVSPWWPSSQPSSHPATVASGATLPIPTTAPQQSITSTDYNLGPVSPQSTWTDTDTQSGSYLDSGVPVLPVFRRQDIPKDGMPMFSDVSLSLYNTSLESGPSVLPKSVVGPGARQSHQTVVENVEVFHSGVSPGGESEQWFMPQPSLDASGLQQPTGGASLEQSPGRLVPGGSKSPETGDCKSDARPFVGESDDESSKLSYAGVVVTESHDVTGDIDDTLQEVMRNVAISESETSKEMGIFEDPDLTLISLDTTLASSVAPDNVNDEVKQSVSEELGSDSLVSFLHHEEELSLESPARSGSDRSCAVGTSSVVEDQVTLTTGTDTSQDQSVSLQEAFSRRKQAFVRSSQSRQLDVKVHAETQQATAFSQTLDNWKRSRGGKVQRSAKTRTAKSQLKGPPVKGKRSSMIGSTQGEKWSLSGEKAQTKERTSKTVTASDRKAVEKDMYQRNVRLYNQLEEVQKQKLTQQRQKDYATNRQRRKAFEQKLQTRLNKLTKQTAKPSS